VACQFGCKSRASRDHTAEDTPIPGLSPSLLGATATVAGCAPLERADFIRSGSTIDEAQVESQGIGEVSMSVRGTKETSALTG